MFEAFRESVSEFMGETRSTVRDFIKEHTFIGTFMENRENSAKEFVQDYGLEDFELNGVAHAYTSMHLAMNNTTWFSELLGTLLEVGVQSSEERDSGHDVVNNFLGNTVADIAKAHDWNSEKADSALADLIKSGFLSTDLTDPRIGDNLNGDYLTSIKDALLGLRFSRDRVSDFVNDLPGPVQESVPASDLNKGGGADPREHGSESNQTSPDPSSSDSAVSDGNSSAGSGTDLPGSGGSISPANDSPPSRTSQPTGRTYTNQVDSGHSNHNENDSDSRSSWDDPPI